MAYPVDTEAEVLDVNNPPTADSVTHDTVKLTLQLSLPGTEPAVIEVKDRGVRVAKWPNFGDRIPVTVDRSNPTKCKVRWSEIKVLSHGQAIDRLMSQAMSKGSKLKQ